MSVLHAESTTGRNRGDRLDSWKEIAVYLNRGVRTVQRWAREGGLPVHRLATEKRGAIYAYKSEVDAWWHSRSSSLTAEREEVVESVASPVRWLQPRSLAIILSVVLAVVILAWAILPLRALEIRDLRRLTFDGDVVTPALSPDGRWFAYASPRSTSDGNLDLWLQAATGGSPSRLTETPVHEFDPAFSRDSSHLLYSVAIRKLEPMTEITGPPSPNGTSLHETDLSGRTRLVMMHANSGRYSPDGRWIAMLRRRTAVAGQAESLELGLMPSVGGEFTAIPIGISPTDELIAASPPLWSPDGLRVLVNARTAQSDYAWWLLSPASRSAVRTNAATQLASAATGSATPFPFANLAPQAWLEDGTILTKGFGSGGVVIWSAKLDLKAGGLKGRPLSLSAPVEDARWLSTSGDAIAFSGGSASGGLVSLPFDLEHATQLGAPHVIRDRNPGGYAELSISRDGRVLAFISRQTSGGMPEAFTRDLASGRETRFSGSGAPVSYAALTSDGTRLAYGIVSPSGKRPIYVVNTTGGESALICDDCSGRPAEWMPDGRGLLITRPMFTPQRIGLLDVETRKAVDILQSRGLALRNPRIAPGGRWMTFLGSDGSCFVAPFRGPEPVLDGEWQRVGIQGQRVESAFWSPDGARIYWMSADERNQAVIMTSSFDSDRGRLIGVAREVFKMDWNPAFARRVRMDAVAGGNRMIIPTAEIQSDIWIGRLRRAPWTF